MKNLSIFIHHILAAWSSMDRKKNQVEMDVFAQYGFVIVNVNIMGLWFWYNKLLCYKLYVWFVLPVSFGGGKHSGELLQNFSIYPLPLPVCIHSAVCNLHSHMCELHTDSHIPTDSSWEEQATLMVVRWSFLCFWIDAHDFMWPITWEKENLHRYRKAESKIKNIGLVVSTE